MYFYIKTEFFHDFFSVELSRRYLWKTENTFNLMYLSVILHQRRKYFTLARALTSKRMNKICYFIQLSTPIWALSCHKALKTIIKLRSAMWNIYNCNRELTLLPTLGCSFSKNMKIYSEWRHKGAMNLWSLTWYVSKILVPSLNHEQ